MYHRMRRSHKARRSHKRHRRHRKTGGSMAGRLAVPAGLLILQKMMHSRKRRSGSKKSMRRTRTRSRK